MSGSDLIPALLLIPFSVALFSGALIVMLAIRWRRRAADRAPNPTHSVPVPAPLSCGGSFFNCPPSWLAVRSRNLRSVQSVLGLNNPRPCTLMQGLAHEHKLFIAPPVNGWILVTGSGLPDVVEDVDVAFRFLSDLSRKLGHVQFFSASRPLGHHAWVRAEGGRVVRAYAWAGKTLWHQGLKTRAEKELNLKCFDYFEAPEGAIFGPGADALSLNTERVPALAARWSLDPSAIDERTMEQACGVSGEPPRLY